MAERIIIVASSDIGLGFQLAGVVTYSVDTISAQELINNLLNESDIGLIVIEENIYSGLDDTFKEKLEKSNYPIIVSIPIVSNIDRRKMIQATTKYVEDMIVRNSGIRIKLN